MSPQTIETIRCSLIGFLLTSAPGAIIATKELIESGWKLQWLDGFFGKMVFRYLPFVWVACLIVVFMI